MAGDKGAEAPKSVNEYLQRPKAVKDTLDYYKKDTGSAFRSAISRAVDSLRRRGRQLPSNETAQKMADKMNSGSTVEPPRDLDASEHAQLRKGSRSGDVRPDLNLRAHHELSALGKKYFDADGKPEPGTGETPKPSEE